MSKTQDTELFEEAGCDESDIKKVFKSKKSEFRKNHEVILELQPRTRSGKCVGACQKLLLQLKNPRERKDPCYNYIPNEIWFLLSLYIHPEDVKTFALICRQSAYTLKSCLFWKQLYLRCCLKKLPDSTHNLSFDKVRRFIIKRLFIHYQPFVVHIKYGVKLDTLLGKVFICHFVTQTDRYWITCYKFRTHFPLSDKHAQIALLPPYESTESSASTFDNWEDLFVEITNGSETNDNYTKVSNYYNSHKEKEEDEEEEEEGVYLLLMRSNTFTGLTFQRDHDQILFRVQNIKETLSTDMSSVNLELIFSSSIQGQIFSVRYHNLVNYEVLPWWHPNHRHLYKTYCKSEENRIIVCSD